MNQENKPVSAVEQPTKLTDERIGELSREAQDQGISGLPPSIYLARAVEREVLARQSPAPEPAWLLRSLVADLLHLLPITFEFAGADRATGSAVISKIRNILAAPVAQEVTQQAAKAEQAAMDKLGGSIKMVVNMLSRDGTPVRIEAAGALLAAFGEAAESLAPTTSTVSASGALAAPDDARTDAARDVLAERRRQVEVEGRTDAHDDQYAQGQMAQAAACYAVQGELHFPEGWPWSLTWWKPSSQRRNLVKAGALILAEIERIDRAAHAATKSED